ncbi:VOC family protein [Nesterenkonia ebinurensis]|uniref:VOC family protein n=1 Tax=Nesterenkonia ebinurensis TaxID=2608252 RepID=UPI00123D2B22|nr:VOC family protein [Nesterenkonia ebinurensis]
MTHSTSEQQPPVKQLRLIVEAEDFDAALTFYRDVLGLPESAAFEGDGEARVAILEAGRATLELSNPAQVKMIDAVEADGRPSARIRPAFEVDDGPARTDDLTDAGAELIAAPRETPWRSLNSRLNAPADLEITLFQELETPDQRHTKPGFKQL